MKQIFIILSVFFCVTSSCNAEEFVYDLEEIQEAMQCPFVYHSVNVTTGEYAEADIDLQSILQMKRCYSSFDSLGQGWFFNFPNLLESNMEDPPETIGDTHYKYDDQNRLSSLECKGKKWEILYPSDLECLIQNENGQELFYRFEKNEDTRSESNLILKEVLRPDGTHVTYQYREHPILRKKLISRRELPDGRFSEIEYYSGSSRKDSDAGKVKSIREPVGVDGEVVETQRLVYHPGFTEVFDAKNEKVIYRYEKSRRLCAIEQYQGEDLYRVERYYWRDDQLVSKTLEDGHGNILLCRSNRYDDKGNCIQHSIYGDLSGCNTTPVIMGKYGIPISNGVEVYRVRFEFDHDNRMKKQIEDNGVELWFQYDEKSDRVSRKLLCKSGEICLRTFYHYDEEKNLSRLVVDDGKRASEEDLEGVSERHIQQISYRDGKPENVEERYLDQGEESLLKRAENHYSSTGQVILQELYDAENQLRRTLSYEYDESDRRICTTDSLGSTAMCSYDANGNVVEVWDEDQHQIKQYDFVDRLIREGEVTCRYDYLGNQISVTDQQGNETEYQYDSMGRVSCMKQPWVLDGNEALLQPEFHYEYDLMDQITVTVDPNGNETRTRYNVRGKPTEVRYADGATEKFEYHLDGSLKRMKAKDGSEVTYTRDYLSRITEENHIDCKGQFRFSIHSDYNAFHLINRIDQEGAATYHYDAGGRLIGEEKGERKTFTGYDAMGEVFWKKGWFATDADAYATMIFERDEKQQVAVMKLVDPDGKILKEQQDEKSEDSNSYEDETVNDLGQSVIRKWQVDEKGFQTIQILDALGRVEVVEKKDPVGELLARQELRYDGVGNQTIHRNFAISEGEIKSVHTICWEYDEGNRIQRKIEGFNTSKQQITGYQYDAAGRITRTVKPDGVQIYYSYDDLGKLGRYYSSDNSVDYQYTYDESGQIQEIQDVVHGNSTYLTEHSEVLGNGLELQYKRDLVGRPTEITLPDHSKILYSYDAAYLRQVTRVSSDGEVQYTHSYEEYDSNGKNQKSQMICNLGEILHANEGIETPYWNEVAQYDDRGNLISIHTEDVFGVSDRGFEYDGLNQLIKGSHSYSYDSLQNRLTKDRSSYEYDTLHQLLSAGKGQYQYDPNGNRIAFDDIQYEYDALDRLTQVKKHDATIRYIYDANHRRLSKTVESAEGIQSIRYLYQGDCEIGSVDEKGQIVELRVLGEGIGAELGAAVAVELEGQVYAPLNDSRGSIRCLIDQNGEVAACCRFSEFGEVENHVGIHLPWRFSGKRWDSETDFIYFGKRYYDVKIGRWLTKDPLGYFDGPNPYAYVQNNPLTNCDLYGLFSISQSWHTFTRFIQGALFYRNETVSWMQNHFSLEDYLYDDYRRISEAVFGETFLLLSGFYRDKPGVGIYGKGEVSDKVRITMVNGIMNIRSHYKKSLTEISDAHGGCNIHFIFYPAGGWTHDILKCLMSKLGFVSPEAKRLAETWREMIEEMGGVDGGGTIIHYAHSIGGTDTLLAKGLMTDEELKMILVITFGSASIIQEGGFQSVTNYVSVRDGIPFLDPVGYIRGKLDPNSNVVFVGSYWGVPLVDHMLISDTYFDVIKFMGHQFVHMYMM